MPQRSSDIKEPRKEPRVTLKTLAEHLHLTAGTISAALNDSAAARAIPEHTKRRILEAARELNYKPNDFARSLRLQRTYTIGVIAQQIGDPYGAGIISGIEEYLRNTEYFFLTVIHRHDQRILQTYSQIAAGARGRRIYHCRYIDQRGACASDSGGCRASARTWGHECHYRPQGRSGWRSRIFWRWTSRNRIFKGTSSSSDSKTRWWRFAMSPKSWGYTSGQS